MYRHKMGKRLKELGYFNFILQECRLFYNHCNISKRNLATIESCNTTANTERQREKKLYWKSLLVNRVTRTQAEQSAEEVSKHRLCDRVSVPHSITVSTSCAYYRNVLSFRNIGNQSPANKCEKRRRGNINALKKINHGTKCSRAEKEGTV